MSATLQMKEETVRGLHKFFAESQSAYLLDFKRCKCKDLTVLRRKLSEKGARLVVVKNKLAKRAIVDTEAAGLAELFVGTTAVVWSKDDPVAPAKVLSDFLKDREDLQLKGGVVDGRVVGAVELKVLADMPSKEQLQANLLAQINAPAVQLLRTIKEPSAQLVRLIEAWRKKLEG